MAVPLAEEHFPPDEITAGIDARALASAAATKEEFIRTRGFWNKERDVLARAMPDYFLASGEFSMTATKSGSLSIKEREMIFLSIDASVNHMSEPGLDIHYRNARKAGLTFREVAAVLKIVGVVGLLSYINSAPRLTR